MTVHHTKLLIIGSGPAGYTAAIYAARANLRPLLVAGMQPGGQLTITTEVENYPGFARAVQGTDLVEQMRQQAEHVGARIVPDTIVSVDLSERPFTAVGDGGDTYRAETLVAATGAQARWLGLPSESDYNGAGISACATCDGFFFRGKEVVVVGGGNTAVEEALYLANLAAKVIVVHRRDRFRAEPILQDRLSAHPRIEVVWNHVVEEILGQREPVKAVTGVRLRDTKSGGVRDLATDGVFVAIGHDPATKLFQGQVEMVDGGYIRISPWSTKTSVPGFFGAGDCAESVYRQAVVAAGMGCMAALEAEKFLADHSADPAVRTAESHEHAMIGAYA